MFKENTDSKGENQMPMSSDKLEKLYHWNRDKKICEELKLIWSTPAGSISHYWFSHSEWFV